MVVLLAGVWVVSVPASGEAGESIDIGSWDDEGHGEIFLRHEAATSEPTDESGSPFDLRRSSMDATAPAGSPPALHPPPLSLPTSPRQSRHPRPPIANTNSAGGPGSRKTQMLSPALGASGFAIGISAASPGFSVLPRRRIASGFSDTVIRAQDAMRRTVSEGDDGGASWNTVQPPAFEHVEQPGLDTSAGSHTQARKRWDWIRSFVRR